MLNLRALRLFTLLLVAGPWLTLAGCGGNAPQDKQPRPPAEVAVALPVVSPIVEWDPYTGRLEAIESVEVRARVDGYLVGHYFEEGQTIEAGALLFLIDPRPYDAALAEAEAALLQAQAAAVEAKSGVTQQTAQRGQVAARLDLAQRRVKRSQPLVPSGAITQDDFDILQSEQRQSQADLKAADATIESAKASFQAALAAIESAKAQRETARLNLEYTRITAPISGRISRRYASKGNLISGGSLGSTLLTTIVSLNPIHCYFDANERALLKYTRLSNKGERESSREAKNPVRMSLVDEQGFPHHGHMDFVDNRVDQQTGTIRGRAIFPNDDLVLSPGMFARVRIPASGKYDALLIPDAAIGSDQADQFVFVVGKENRVTRRVVQLGPMAKGMRIVHSGLEPTERIVVGGLQRVSEGEQITPVEQTLEASDQAGEGLPNEYKPVPREEWLTPGPLKLPPARPADQPAAAGAGGRQ